MSNIIINAFVEAAQEVLAAEAALTVSRGPLQTFGQPYITDDITVLLNLVGNITGTVLYSLSEKTALELIGRLMGEPVRAFDSLAQSGIAELGNVITGLAASKLARIGYAVTISPPTLLMGRGTALSTLDLPRQFVPLYGEEGQAGLHLALATRL
jgi:chemotaxis protein CheX